MNATNKEQITESLRQFCKQKGSQNKASLALNGVSSATISQILSGKIELVADEMWRNIASQIKANIPMEWVVVETRDFKKLNLLFEDAQQHSNVYAVVGRAGSGKTKTIQHYAMDHDNVYHLSCSEYWNKKYFLQELLRSASIDYYGLTIPEMMHEAITKLPKKEKPIIILDEADKLTDSVLYFFITLYNKLEDRCGIVLCATKFLELRIKRGLKNNKKGFEEIDSRINNKCIELDGVGFTDVMQICMANGIENKEWIKKVWDDSQLNLRRVKRKIHALKQKMNANQED